MTRRRNLLSKSSLCEGEVWLESFCLCSEEGVTVRKKIISCGAVSCLLFLIATIMQGRIQKFLAGGWGGGPNFTRYVETVSQLITSTPRQFSVVVHHIP